MPDITPTEQNYNVVSGGMGHYPARGSAFGDGTNKPIPVLPGRAIFDQISISVDNIRAVYRLSALIQGDSRPVWHSASESFDVIQLKPAAPEPVDEPEEVEDEEDQDQQPPAQKPEPELATRFSISAQAARALFNEDVDPEEGAPFTMKWVNEQYLVDGDMVGYRPTGVEGVADADVKIQWLTQLLLVTPDLVEQRFDFVPPEEMGQFFAYRQNPRAIIRRLMRGPTDPDVFTVSFVKYEAGKEVDASEDAKKLAANASADQFPATIPASDLHIFPFGKGILFHPGRAIQRLMEIQEELRADDFANRMRQAKGASAYGGATQQLKNAMAEGDRIVGTPAAVELIDHASAVHATQLRADKEQLSREVMEVLHCLPLDASADISGALQRLLMQDMVTFVRLARRDISKVYASFGGRVEWSPIFVSEAQERQADRDLFLSTLDLIQRIAPGAVPPEQVLRRLKTYL